MKYADFMMLDESRQCLEIFNFCRFVSHRQIMGKWVALYMLHAFYVEIWYSPDLKSFDKVYAFEDATCLEPYLESIELPDLFLTK
jgi:hypothetical protein